jgi:spermidine/putrescine transport system ATP-binding protein
MNLAGTSALIRLDRVTKQYGDLTAVADLSLDIAAGTFLAMMGPSGCGKTTTLRLLAGLETPNSGDIWFNGQVITHKEPWHRNMPMVWQNLALFPYLNVLENVCFGLRMAGVRGTSARDRAMAWLARLGIDHLAQSHVGHISGGQAQRVALARSLVLEPQVLLLDEPLSALDAHLVVRMQAELTALQRELGITFLYVTHNQSEAFAMADRVVIMNEGRIQQNGTPREVFRQPTNRFVAEFVGTNNIFSGRIAELSREVAVVDAPEGKLPARRPEGGAMAEGAPVDLVISADLVHLSKEPVGHWSIPVSLISEQFVGTMVTLHLDTENDRTLKVQMPQRVFDAFDVRHGARLFAFWDAESALLLSGKG